MVDANRNQRCYTYGDGQTKVEVKNPAGRVDANWYRRSVDRESRPAQRQYISRATWPDNSQYVSRVAPEARAYTTDAQDLAGVYSTIKGDVYPLMLATGGLP